MYRVQCLSVCILGNDCPHTSEENVRLLNIGGTTKPLITFPIPFLFISAKFSLKLNWIVLYVSASSDHSTP